VPILHLCNFYYMIDVKGKNETMCVLWNEAVSTCVVCDLFRDS
jgi:hypothetical protein